MKKLYTLKSWFSLPDAAERLSTGLGEPITEKDILQLVVEGHLPISWMVREAHARAVAPFVKLVGQGYNPKLSDFIFAENPADAETHLVLDYTWVPVRDIISVQPIKGVFRLELGHSPFVLEWLHSLITNKRFSQGTLNGLIISDQEGTFWQQMELIPNPPDDFWKFENHDKRYQPSSTLPGPSELVITREDIEHFEKSLLDSEAGQNVNLSPRSEKTYLHIIGALLDVIANGIPDSNTQAKVGPAAGFSSEAKLIFSIAAHYQGYDGLSKRNLEGKFAIAKRTLESSQ